MGRGCRTDTEHPIARSSKFPGEFRSGVGAIDLALVVLSSGIKRVRGVRVSEVCCSGSLAHVSYQRLTRVEAENLDGGRCKDGLNEVLHLLRSGWNSGSSTISAFPVNPNWHKQENQMEESEGTPLGRVGSNDENVPSTPIDLHEHCPFHTPA